jgi:hypothetical protein
MATSNVGAGTGTECMLVLEPAPLPRAGTLVGSGHH